MSSRVAQLIRCFVQRVPNAGRTRIAKFLYMADHEARRYLGRPLTDLVYHWDNFGPFDDRIQQEMSRLVEGGYVEEEVNRDPQDDYYWYRYRPTPKPLECPLRNEEEAILDYVVKHYADMRLGDFLESVVYQTRPMKAAKMPGERLRMELVDNERRLAGLELENVIESAEELRSGGGRSFEEILAETNE